MDRIYQLKPYESAAKKTPSSHSDLERSDIGRTAAGQLSNQLLCRLLVPANPHEFYPNTTIQCNLESDDKNSVVAHYHSLLKKYGIENDANTNSILNTIIEKCTSPDTAMKCLDDDLLEYKMMNDAKSVLSGTIPMIYPEIEASFSDELSTILKEEVPDSRRLILCIIRQSPAFLAPRFAEKSIDDSREGMPYYHHAQMVMNQFNKYFSGTSGAASSSELISDNLMRMMLAFHDIDKQRSISRHGKIGEHMDTAETMAYFSKKWPFKKVQKDIAVAMVSADPFGDFFKELKTQIDRRVSAEEFKKIYMKTCERCIQNIMSQAMRAGVPNDKLVEFFDRYVQFYQSDYSSYSIDSSYMDKQKTGARLGGWHSGPASFTPERFERKEGAGGPFDKTAVGYLKFTTVSYDNALMDLREMISGKNKCGISVNSSDFLNAVHKQILSEDDNRKKRLELEKVQETAVVKKKNIKELNFYDFIDKVYLPLADRYGLYQLVNEIALKNIPTTIMEASEKEQWIDYCQHIMELGSSSANRVMQDFAEPYGGVFIRKLLPEYESTGKKSENSARKMIEKEMNSILNNILRQPLTPFVLPATYIAKEVPTSLTDAQGGLYYSSGIIYDKNVELAPSSKEHNESAHLSHVLTEQVRARIHDKETWRGIVREVIHPIGGTSFETREELAMKMREMDDRRRGASPDLSTKELLSTIIEGIMKESNNLNEQIGLQEFKNACESQVKSTTVQNQLQNAFLLYSKDREHLCLSDIPQRTKPRNDRERSIYGGGKRRRNPGNRYHLAEGNSEHPIAAVSSEKDRYSGATFQTNEALLLPDDLERIAGIYVNRRAILSLIHSINLARELYIQTNKSVPFFTYEAKEDLNPINLEAIFSVIEEKIKHKEPLTGEVPHVDLQSNVASGSDRTSAQDEVIRTTENKVSVVPTTAHTKPVTNQNKLKLAFFASVAKHLETQIKWLPDAKPPKKRKNDV